MESSEAATAFAALSQDARLNLLRLLMAQGPSGLPAGELASRLGIPASTTSFHLAALERAGLTPELCGDLATLLPPWPDEDQGMTPAFNVLFLCTHNSARSIMAEAILEKHGGGRCHAYSAGSQPIKEPNPEVMEKLRVLGHDTAQLRSKSWNEFTGATAPHMDFVITLCDTPHGQECPDFGNVSVTAAWPLPDPSKFTGSAIERAALLNELYASLQRRIGIFTALPFASLDRMALKARLDELAGGSLPVAVGSR